MFETYLKEGDVIYLKSGMWVGMTGSRLTLVNQDMSPFCPSFGHIYVKVGKDYISRTDVSKERSRLREIIKQAFTDDFIPLDESILDRFLAHQVRDVEKVSLYVHPTRYVVTEVKIDGKKRIVCCKEAFNENGHSVYFYQGPSEVRGQLVHNWVQRLE